MFFVWFCNFQIGCCGYNGYQDYILNNDNINHTIPYSCCKKSENSFCSEYDVIAVGYKGCKGKLYPIINNYANYIQCSALGIAAIEVIVLILLSKKNVSLVV